MFIVFHKRYTQDEKIGVIGRAIKSKWFTMSVNSNTKVSRY